MKGVKNNNTLVVYIAVGIAAVLILIGVIMLVLSGNDSKLFYGEWECEEDVVVNIDKTNFNMKYTKLNVNIEATYNIKEEKDKQSDKQSYNTYIINVSATKVEIGDQVSTDELKTKYQLVIDSKNDTKMVMTNKDSNAEYKCTKKA